MTEPLTAEQMREAVQTCANEPVHTPGTIQPIGYLLGCRMADGIVEHASENCAELFGQPIEQIFGQDIGDLMGREIWHSLVNLASAGDFAVRRHFAGIWHHDGVDHAVHCSKGGDHFVLEIEGEGETPKASPDIIREQTFLIGQIEHCETLDELFDLTTKLLRYVTGFDRVKVIQFDNDWNGEVIAENRTALLDPLLGLHFPETDIPAQARDIMAKLPLRIIADVGQEPVPLLAAGPDVPPLDITYANCRGVSAVHMQYLQNMGIAGTMTLSINVGDELWGYVSFHNRKPYFVSPDIRHILLGFLPVLRLKVDLIRRGTALEISRIVDELQTQVQAELEGDTELGEIVKRVGPAITKALGASGVVMTSGSQDFSYGKVPESSVIAALAEKATKAERRTFATDCLSDALPQLKSRLDGFGGVLVTLHEGDRSLQVFREEISQSVSWAGNPTKTVEEVDGNLRLEPRRSFSAYLQTVEGRSKAWSREEGHIMRQLWPLLGAAERRAFMADLNRQQTLMINELNHRVRNILSLVKSVSSQARKSGGSLESYSNALEARIHALAAAHDIGAGAARTAVSIARMVRMEAEPFDEDHKSRVRVRGVDANVRAEAAPIFALVIHELMTNAVKYGALSAPSGMVDVEMKKDAEGLEIIWTERGGPKVKQPVSSGFGSTLILQAVPYEMGGKSDMQFEEAGLTARLQVPDSALEAGGDTLAPIQDKVIANPDDRVTALRNGLVLLLEDNFMIAEAVRTELEKAGFVNVEMLSSQDAALRFLEDATPAFALLDVNLGHGQTSERVASELLLRNVPILFVTGYGEQNDLPAHLRMVPVLTKPVATRELLAAIHAMNE